MKPKVKEEILALLTEKPKLGHRRGSTRVGLSEGLDSIPNMPVDGGEESIYRPEGLLM
ncbi:hypothetical protein DY000_02045535 [Brassica cretica]|uniref:Uncharacterized protein n=1 Tax=Brassica cretica TaxID=69181 RepID=A0ABQ7F4I1_BRACR|nr:hypothetical protein DY000_02045535 [Brassica cretica]